MSWIKKIQPINLSFNWVPSTWIKILKNSTQDQIGLWIDLNREHSNVFLSNNYNAYSKMWQSKFIKDLKPMALWNFVYNILSNVVLANRLHKVIGECISEEQFALVKGRSILDHSRSGTNYLFI